MKQRQNLEPRQITKLSQQTRLIIGVGAGILIGASLAIVALRVDFSSETAADPIPQEEVGRTEDPQRRPPAAHQGGTLRSDSLEGNHAPGSTPSLR